MSAETETDQRDREIWRRQNRAATSLLQEAWALIADPADWTRGTWARDVGWRPCEPESSEAVRWSARGAVMSAGRGHVRARNTALRLVERAAYRLYDESIDFVEDTMFHEDVAAVFAEALERTTCREWPSR